MKINSRKYCFDGNPLHLIIGSIANDARWFKKSISITIEDAVEIACIAFTPIFTLIVIPFVLAYYPIMTIFGIVKKARMLRFRTMASQENMPVDNLLWNAKDKCVWEWHEGYTSALEQGLFFLPNKSDMRKYWEKQTLTNQFPSESGKGDKP